MKGIEAMTEWDLAVNHRDALREEDYKKCQLIKEEIDRRIENNTINHAFMNGFKYYDPVLKEFTGSPNFEPFNGLFDNYKYPEKYENI